jgi:hypothetical protein
MESINDNTQLINIFHHPSYNNLDEPRPFTNEPGCLIGFTTAFLVRFRPSLTCHPWKHRADQLLGAIMDIRLPSALCSPANGASAGLG